MKALISKRAELPPIPPETSQWLSTSENSNQHKFADNIQSASFTQIGMSFCNSSGWVNRGQM